MAGNIWYIGTSGRDSNAGTIDQPFATVAAANKVVQPGDTVYFLTGTYQNSTFRDGNVWKASTDTIIKINNVHGTADAPITYAAARDAHVVLQYDGNGAITIRGSSYIRIEGFDIEGPNGQISLQDALDNQYLYRVPVRDAEGNIVKDAGGATLYEQHYRNPTEIIGGPDDPLGRPTLAQQGAEKPQMYNAAAIALPNGSHHIEIVGNKIHDTPANAISAQGGNDYLTITGNEIYNTTWYASSGTHAITLKYLDSLDASDYEKIFVTNNTFRDNYNLMISWVQSKPVETQHIDEGKPILVQNSLATADPVSGTVWDHGRVLIANNEIVRSGSAGVVVNDGRGVDILNNTIVDPGYINQFFAEEQVAGSPFAATFTDPATGQQVAGFFQTQRIEPGWKMITGGIRLTGTHDVNVANNLISIADPTQYAIDADADVKASNTWTGANMYAGGKGLRIRSETGAPGGLAAGFAGTSDIGFVDAANGDYRLAATSPAIDAGVAQIFDLATDEVKSDFSALIVSGLGGQLRSNGLIDVGAHEAMTISDAGNGCSIATSPSCNCPICSGTAPPPGTAEAPVADAAGIVQLDAQGFLLDVSNPASGLVGTQLSGLPIWDSYQTAAHIARPGGTWADYNNLTVTYTFDPSQIQSGGTMAAFDADYQRVTREIFRIYSEIIGVNFVEVTGTTHADMTFQNIVGQHGGGGWANYPSVDGGYVSIGYPWDAGDVNAGSYVYLTILHEIGHALGLAHPGPYNGSADRATQVDYWNDTNQYSVMSYYGESYTGGSFGNATTPMLHDILALQMEYGANTATRSGNTVYGYNNTTDLAAYDLSSTATGGTVNLAFSIWDGGGNDTLDFSGSTSATVLDLRQGAFSSVNGQIYNVSIAYGAVIENGVGSNNADKMRGNDAGNRLEGGLGNDVIYGGSDTPVVATVNPRDFVGMQLNEAPLTRSQYLQATNVFVLSGATFTFEELVKIDRVPSNAVEFASYNVSGNDNQFILEGGSDGAIKLTIANNASLVTTIKTETLVDGNPHRLSLTWDNASGTASFYIDGTLQYSAIYTAAIGATIGSGGTLVIGQEQDSVGGGFDIKQVFQGTVGDIRIFNTARSAAEIAGSAFTPLTGSESGLVNNWQVKAGDTTTISDVATANPPVNLTDLMPSAFTATQSSTYPGSHAASNVLDNDTGTQNHTNAGANEWLLVTFDRPMQVAFVQVQNVTGWGARLNGATVSVLDVAGNAVYTSAPISGEGYYGSNLTFMLPAPVVAGSVRIDHHNENLHIVELNVYGTAPAGVTVPPALLNTDLTVYGGATVVNTAPVIDTSPDNDTLNGGWGNDTLYGGAGNDLLSGKGDAAAATFDPTYAVELNPTGVTNQYAGIAGFGGFSGLKTFTIEMLARVSRLPGSEVDFFSFAQSGNTNAFELYATNNDKIGLLINGADHVTTLNSSLLTDGNVHRISVAVNLNATSVSNPLGPRFVITIDGGTYTYTAASSSTTALGTGTLVFGQEQDSVGGGFNSSQILTGAISDIRIFNTMRSDTEIAQNYNKQLTDLTDTTLVANWQPASGNTTTVADARFPNDSTKALTLYNAPAAVLLGDWDNDSLAGGLGNDTLTGGAGADAFVRDNNDASAAQADVVADFTVGTDRLDLTQSNAPASMTALTDWLLRTTGSRNTAAGDVLLLSIWNDRQQTLRLNGVAADLSSGTLATALSADDFVFDVSAASRVVAGTNGSDAVFGGLGGDVLSGGGGGDLIVGDAGNDELNGEAGTDLFDGGAGADTFNGGADTDSVYFMRRVDFTLSGGVAAAIASTLAGDESIGDTFSSIERLRGSRFDDTITIDVSLADLLGFDGNDRLTGSSGANNIYGGNGDDTIAGGGGADYIEGNAGADSIDGTASTAGIVAVGGTGNDTIRGGSARDVLHGDDGDDTVFGGGGDEIYGGAGIDRLDASAANARMYAWGGDDGDIVLGGTANDLLVGDNGDDSIDGGNGNDQLVGGSGTDTLAGGSGNDQIWGDGGNDRILGGDGGDKLFGGAGVDTIDGEGGDDYFIDEDGMSGDVYVGGSGSNVLYYQTAGTFDFRAVGADTYDADISWIVFQDIANANARLGQVAHLLGSGLNDTLTGGDADDWLRGGDGGDLLNGGAGNDRLVGGNGNDTLEAGGGSDSYEGDAGADTFVLRDVSGWVNTPGVADFSAAEGDMLALEAIDFGLLAGPLAGSRFITCNNYWSNTPVMVSASATLIYDTSNGYLYFDANGSAAGGLTMAGILQGAPTLTAASVKLV